MTAVCIANPDDDDLTDWAVDPEHILLNNSLRFIMLQGLPASGKSTYARRLEQEGYLLISSDDIRVELTGDMTDQSKNHIIFNDIIPSRIVGAAASRRDVVYDATSYCRARRKDIIAQAKRCGYKVYVHLLMTPYEECLRRNQARERRVPEHVIDRMHDNWENPSLDEGIDGIMYIESP